jgi:2-keto-4-pentenoate hydratase
VVRVAGRVGGGLRELTPAAVVGLLCAGALGPVLAVPGIIGVTGAAAIAGVGVLGSIGANVLTDVVLRAMGRMRDQGDEPDREAIEDELALTIEKELRRGGETADRLLAEVAAVIRAIDGIEAVVEAAVRTGDREIQQQVVAKVGGLSTDFAEFGFVLADVQVATAEIQETQRRQDVEHRADRDRDRNRPCRCD